MIKNITVELDKLKKRILQLGSEVEANLIKAEAALVDFDQKLAAEIIATDTDIDTLEISVEENCLKILAQHTPVARDLRFVVSVLKINIDLERIGDLTVKIADRILLLARQDYVPFTSPQMPYACRLRLSSRTIRANNSISACSSVCQEALSVSPTMRPISLKMSSTCSRVRSSVMQ